MSAQCVTSPAKFQLRRDAAARWLLTNPILFAGEPGIETDTGQMKIGDGVHTWSALAYVGSGTRGFQGFTGPNGFQGLQGIGGTNGAQGFQGLQGIGGTNGNNGAQGFQGLQGIGGTNGAQGFQGLQGIDGTNGAQGFQGFQGFQGVTGAGFTTIGGSTTSGNLLTAAGTTNSANGQSNLTFNGTTLNVSGNVTTSSGLSNQIGGVTLSNTAITTAGAITTGAGTSNSVGGVTLNSGSVGIGLNPSNLLDILVPFKSGPADYGNARITSTTTGNTTWSNSNIPTSTYRVLPGIQTSGLMLTDGTQTYGGNINGGVNIPSGAGVLSLGTMQAATGYVTETMRSTGCNTWFPASGGVQITGRNGLTVQTQGSVFIPGAAASGTGYVVSSASSNLATAFGASNFTIEFWVYPTYAPTTSSYITFFVVGNAAAGAEIRIGQGMGSLTNAGFLIPNAASDSNVSVVDATANRITINTWSHIALVRNSSTVTMFYNGTAICSNTSAAFTFQNAGPIYLGRTPYSSDPGYYTGFIGGLRITNGTALYTAPFTPPTSAFTFVSGTSLLMNMFSSATALTDSANGTGFAFANSAAWSPATPLGNSTLATIGTGATIQQQVNPAASTPTGATTGRFTQIIAQSGGYIQLQGATGSVVQLAPNGDITFNGGNIYTNPTGYSLFTSSNQTWFFQNASSGYSNVFTISGGGNLSNSNATSNNIGGLILSNSSLISSTNALTFGNSVNSAVIVVNGVNTYMGSLFTNSISANSPGAVTIANSYSTSNINFVTNGGSWIFSNSSTSSNVVTIAAGGNLSNSNATSNNIGGVVLSNGYLGVGTFADSTFSINAAGYIEGTAFFGRTPDSNSNAVVQMFSNGNGAGNAYAVSFGSYVRSASARTDIRIDAFNNTNTCNIAYFDATNIRMGIGTATPAYTLDVAGLSRFGSALVGASTTYGSNWAMFQHYSLAGSDGTAYALLQYYLGSETLLNAASGGVINFRIGNSTKMRMNSSGLSIGNGDTNPAYTLDVGGSASLGGVVINNSVISSPTATNLQITTPAGYNLTINPANQLIMSGNVVYLTSGTNTTFTVPSGCNWIYQNGSSVVLTISGSGNISNSNATSNTIGGALISNSYVAASNLVGYSRAVAGISITPVGPLTLLNGNTGTPASQIDFQWAGGGNGYNHFITSRHNNSSSAVSGNAIDFYLFLAGGQTGSTGPGTCNVNMMSVTAAGVGINTSNPTYTLDVNGTARANSFSNESTTSNSISGAKLANGFISNQIQGSVFIPGAAGASPQGFIVSTNTGNTATAFAGSNFTIEFWAYPTAVQQTGYTSFFSIGNNPAGDEIRIWQGAGSSGLGFLIPNGGSYAVSSPSTTQCPINTWTHIALARVGSTTTMYSNGTSVSATTNSFTLPNAGNIRIGSSAYPSSDPNYTGFIGGLRIIKGSALYTANFTPPTTLSNVSGTSLLMNMYSNAPLVDSVNATAFTFSNGAVWSAGSPNITSTTYATGGAITITNGYAVHVFTGSGTFTPLVPLTVQVLVVGGGGSGGGGNGGGGGGAGATTVSSVNVSNATTVTIGTGGVASANGAMGSNGQSSSFGSVSAIGGGGGGAMYGTGLTGGSGGGGGGNYTTPSYAGGLGLVGYGGGAGASTGYLGGGGGGASAVGGVAAGALSGSGGAGQTFIIGGVSYLLAGGGGGGALSLSAPGSGGIGGGGTGGWDHGGAAAAGTANTGGGGGGGAYGDTGGIGAAGGSGIVVVAYPIYSLDIGGTLRVQGSTNISGGASALPTTVSSNHWTVSGFSNTITSITGTYSSNVTNDATIYTFLTGTGGFIVPSGGLVVDYLIVGGGGGGGTWIGGGGGAGGLVYAKDVQIPAGTYTWTVGAGGSATSSAFVAAGNGGNSSVSTNGLTLTALGGGGGLSYGGPAPVAGGSGGGAAYGTATGTGAIGQGNNGGAITTAQASGGGGAGSVGGGGASSPGVGGNGLAISITGSNVYYAGGGGACGAEMIGALGGLGGGAMGAYGSGNSQVTAPGNGVANTGGGGGGGTRGATYPGSGTSGLGGSGVIILRVYTNTNTRMLIGDGSGYSMSLASQSNSVTNDVFTVSDQGNVSIGMSNALFSDPTYCAFDSLSNMYVAEFSNHRIRKITPGGVVTTVLGNGAASNSTGLYGTAASIWQPYGIAVDSNNNLFISSFANQIIYFNTTTGLSTIVAGNGTGTSTNGNGTAATFYQPRMMVYDASGPWVWIAESGGNNIRKMLAVSPYTVTTLSSNANGINLPIGIALDNSSNLYIGNYSGANLIKISSIYGTPTYSNVATSITNIAGVCLDSAKTTLYITETSTSTIKKVATTGGTVTTVAGSTTATATTNIDATGTSALFYYPNSVTLDPSGSNIYIAEQPAQKIRKLTIANSNVTTYAGTGVAGYREGSIPTTTTVNNTLAVSQINTAGALTFINGSYTRSLTMDSSGRLCWNGVAITS